MKNQEQKNIDKIFKTTFDRLEESPPAYVWDNISGSLDAGLRKKRANYLWLAAASVAVIISFFGGYYFSRMTMTENTIATVPVKTNNSEIQNPQLQSIQSNPRVDVETPLTSTPQVITVTQPEKIFRELKLNDQPPVFNPESAMSYIPPLPQKNEEFIPFRIEVKTPEKEPEPVIAAVQTRIIDTAALTSELIKQSEVKWSYVMNPGKSRPSVRWTVGPSVAPLYSYRELGGGTREFANEADLYLSTLRGNDKQYFNSTEEGVVGFSTGFQVAYALMKNLSIESGMKISQIGQVSKEVFLFEQTDLAGETYSIVNSSLGPIVNSNPALQKFASVDRSQLVTLVLGGNALYLNNSDLHQYFNYFEIPVTAKYSISLNNYRFYLSSGLHQGFLIANNAYLTSEGNKYYVGKTNNISKALLSASFGLGFGYALSSNTMFNIEPLFRYALTSVNSRSGPANHPYSMGTMMGLMYDLK